MCIFDCKILHFGIPFVSVFKNSLKEKILNKREKKSSRRIDLRSYLKGSSHSWKTMVCTHTHMHTITHTHIHTSSHTYNHLYTRSKHTYSITYTHSLIHIQIHTHTHTNAYTLILSFTYTHTKAYTHTLKCIYTASHTLSQKHIHSLTYTHTQMYIHSHTHTHSNSYAYAFIRIHAHIQERNEDMHIICRTILDIFMTCINIYSGGGIVVRSGGECDGKGACTSSFFSFLLVLISSFTLCMQGSTDLGRCL